MTLTEIRTQLLAEHARLRELARTAVAEAERLLAGATEKIDALRAALRALDQAVVEHNRHEERALRNIIGTIDAWGGIRQALMNERHESEHATLLQSLRECSSVADSADAGARAKRLLGLVLEHMDREEREILSPDVLRDDIVTMQNFGG